VILRESACMVVADPSSCRESALVIRSATDASIGSPTVAAIRTNHQAAASSRGSFSSLNFRPS